MFTRKEYATSVSGKTANGCPVRSAEPPDNIGFDFILRLRAQNSARLFRLPFSLEIVYNSFV